MILNHKKTLEQALDFNQLLHIISIAKQYQDPLSMILKYLKVDSLNQNTIITQLQLLHEKTSDRSTKIRITKLINNLESELKNSEKMESSLHQNNS